MRRLGLASPGHAIMPWRGDPVSTLRRFDRHPLQLHCHGHALRPWIDPDPVEGVAAVAEGSTRPRFTLVELHEAGFLYYRSRHHHPTASRRAGDQAGRPRHLVRSVVLDLALDVPVDPSRVAGLDLIEGPTPRSRWLASVRGRDRAVQSRCRANLTALLCAPGREQDHHCGNLPDTHKSSHAPVSSFRMAFLRDVVRLSLPTPLMEMPGCLGADSPQRKRHGVPGRDTECEDSTRVISEGREDEDE